MIETKFSLLLQKDQVRDYYWENGYVILSNILADDLIDAFIKSYEDIKADSQFVFYSQCTHRVVKPTLTEHGFISESMENATRLGLYPEFSGSMKKCLFNDNISRVLKLISGHELHVMWQNMFFDKSTGTIEHQDHWYLDTVPHGNLIGAWYALEDIREESGPFFLVPGSHKRDVIERTDASTHEEFRKQTLKMVDKNKYQFESCLLNKGDVLFWHPMTVHGSHDALDDGCSRKSFTAHFFPYGMQLTMEKNIPSIAPTDNTQLFCFNLGSEIEYNKRLIQAYAKSRDETPVVCDMRRSSYSD